MHLFENSILNGFIEEREVDTELNKLLGIDDQEILVEVLNRAIAKWRGAITPNHPATAKGDDFYNHSVVALREMLKPFGFAPLSKSNVQLTINKERGVAIYCCRGDERIGISEGKPRTLRARGDCTLNLLGLSEDTDPTSLDLFPSDPELRLADFDVWVLLTYIDQSGGRSSFRAELSHPKSHTKGFINSFDKRIILNTTSRDVVEEKSGSESFNDAIDFDLPEKTA
ncbi:hypothetical protein [Leucothrix arctica]|nr:hypothetical protein [Leucothrix arctica]